MFKFFNICHWLQNIHLRGFFNSREERSSHGFVGHSHCLSEENRRSGVICWTVKL